MINKTVVILCILLCLFGAQTGWAAAPGVDVQRIRLSSGPDKTRVVLDISGPVAHNIFTLHDPERVVIDLRGGRLKPGGATLPEGRGSVRRVRTGAQGGKDLRVVLDLDASVKVSSFIAAPSEQYGHRLVIDLASGASAKPVKTVKSVAAPRNRGRDVIVAVDAGHGGKDPGARGKGGTREKKVVLQIARKLKARIDKEPGMRAVMIRDGDYLVDLRRRMELARKHSADLFVSIHADAVKNRRARGASVYVLSERGASSEAARRLAARENAADLIGGASLANTDEEVASVIIDLMQNASISAAIAAGENVLSELGRVGKLHGKKVQSARFVVLKSPEVPSILVETAFISNPSEEKRLRDSRHQEQYAGAIFKGIRRYFYDNPPNDSYLAGVRDRPRQAPTTHVIARGDTLSGIASRYNVSQRTLRLANKLRGDRIRVGQVLKIPTS